MRKIIIIATVFVIAVLNVLIVQKEIIIDKGKTILLPLAPVDPRSIMQGDYMILRYALAAHISKNDPAKISDGKVILKINKDGVASYIRLLEKNSKLQKDEWLLKYKKRDSKVRLVAESFFFQEGHSDYFAKAKYGELKVAKDGSPVLIGLRDEKLQKMMAPVDATKKK